MTFSRTAAFLAIFTLGCGGRSDRTPLTGTVTYDGQPVRGGQIVFTGSANAGVAVIKDGVYSTLEGREPTLGAQTARLELCDGVASEMQPSGQPIAPLQQVEIDLPPGVTTWDFNLSPPTPKKRKS